MARPKLPKNEVREKVTIRIHPALLEWARDRVGPGKPYHNLTHAVESGLACLQAAEAPKEPRPKAKGEK